MCFITKSSTFERGGCEKTCVLPYKMVVKSWKKHVFYQEKKRKRSVFEHIWARKLWNNTCFTVRNGRQMVKSTCFTIYFGALLLKSTCFTVSNAAFLLPRGDPWQNPRTEGKLSLKGSNLLEAQQALLCGPCWCQAGVLKDVPPDCTCSTWVLRGRACRRALSLGFRV